METNPWLLTLALVGVALVQLTSIARSLQSTTAMMRRLLAHQGIEWEVAIEPSAQVRELASNAKTRVAAIKAYREQSGLGLAEAKAVIDRLPDRARGAA